MSTIYVCVFETAFRRSCLIWTGSLMGSRVWLESFAQDHSEEYIHIHI